MKGPPPKPPLFPYTTLFRSDCAEASPAARQNTATLVTFQRCGNQWDKPPACPSERSSDLFWSIPSLCGIRRRKRKPAPTLACAPSETVPCATPCTPPPPPACP